MMDIERLLLPGEYKIGEYQVAIVRQTDAGWSPTVPPLNALVTNYRLILQPQTRRPYQPASIPATYIMRVTEIDFGPRRGVRVTLRTGHRLHMMPSWTQGDRLAEAIRAMLISPVGNEFKVHPAGRDLRRLISFIQRL